MKYGYQIIEEIPSSEYNRRAKQYAAQGKYNSARIAFDQSAAYIREGLPVGGTGGRTDSALLEHRRKDTEISSMDEQQVQRGNVSSEQAPANRGSGTNRQRRNGPSVKTQIKQLRSEIRELEDRRDFAYDKIEKRSIQEEIDEREYRIRQFREEGKNQPQRSDRIEEDSTIPADITEEMRQRGEKAIATATAQREAKVAAEQKAHRAIRAVLTNRDLIAQTKGKGGGFTDKNAHIQQRKAEEETAYIAESCFR